MQVGVRSRSGWPMRTSCVDAMRCLPCRIVPGGPTGVADRRRRRGARHPFVGRLRAAPPAVRTARRTEAPVRGGVVVDVAFGARGPRVRVGFPEERSRLGRPAHRVRGFAAVRPPVGRGGVAGHDLVGALGGERVLAPLLVVVVPVPVAVRVRAVHGAEHVPELAQNFSGSGRGRRPPQRRARPRDRRSHRRAGPRGRRTRRGRRW